MGHSSHNSLTPWLNAIATLPISDNLQSIPDPRTLKLLPLLKQPSTRWFLCGISGTVLLAWQAQGILTTGLLAYLAWQQWQRSHQPPRTIEPPLHPPTTFDDWLLILHSDQPIDRIRALHQLDRLATDHRTTELLDYLRYLREQDSDPHIRQIADRLIQQRQPTDRLAPSHQISMEEMTLFATNLHEVDRHELDR